MAKSKSVLPSKASATKREKHWDDPHFQERAPGLYEFLSAALLDGEERKGGSVTLFCSNGALKVCFHDRQTLLTFYAVLDGTGELYAVLEEILQGDHEPWSASKHNPGKVPF